MEVGEVTVILTLVLTLTKRTKEENGEGKRKISVYFVISLPSLFGINGGMLAWILYNAT